MKPNIAQLAIAASDGKGINATTTSGGTDYHFSRWTERIQEFFETFLVAIRWLAYPATSKTTTTPEIGETTIRFHRARCVLVSSILRLDTCHPRPRTELSILSHQSFLKHPVEFELAEIIITELSCLKIVYGAVASTKKA